MKNKTMFEEMLDSKEYQEILAMLPDDEKKELLVTLKKMVDDWENNVVEPLKKLNEK